VYVLIGYEAKVQIFHVGKNPTVNFFLPYYNREVILWTRSSGDSSYSPPIQAFTSPLNSGLFLVLILESFASSKYLLQSTKEFNSWSIDKIVTFIWYMLIGYEAKVLKTPVGKKPKRGFFEIIFYGIPKP
jgi:hypothetical protein